MKKIEKKRKGTECEESPDKQHCWHDVWSGDDPCQYYTIGKICCWCGVTLIKCKRSAWAGQPEKPAEKHGNFENWDGLV